MLHKESGINKNFGDMFIRRISRGGRIIQNEKFLDMTDKINIKITSAILDYARLNYNRDMGLEKTKYELVKSYGDTALRGYAPFVDIDMPLEHIERIDELDIYDSDLEASEQAMRDGLKFLNITIDEEPYSWYNGTILDTEENRKMIDNKDLGFEVRYNNEEIL